MKYPSFDVFLAFTCLLLLFFGLLMLYSFGIGTGQTFFQSKFTRQLIYGGLGIGLAVIVSRVDYRTFRSYANYLYFGMIGVLGFLLITGSVVRGTVGWMNFGVFQIQPVEFAKIVLIIFLASFISHKKSRLYEISRLTASLILAGVFIAMVLLQPDFGSSMILVGIWFGMMFVSGISKKYIILIVCLGIISSFIGLHFLADYQKERLLTVFYPQMDARGSGYNVIQAMVSIGSGGLFGKGIGQGTQSQLNFLPEKHTDFIFAAMAESLGLFGIMTILFLFGTLLYRIRKIAEKAPDNFGFLVASGILIMFLVQISVNVGMNMGIFPITGIPLPLVSYGGSSLISSCFSIGILANIFRMGELSHKVEGRIMNEY